MQSQLEQLENDSDIEWLEYKVGDLFESFNGDFDLQKVHINDKGCYVITAGLTENGVLGKTDVEAKIFDAKTITIDMFGNAFYRQFQYKMVTHARVFSLQPKFAITDNQGLFLSSLFYFLNKKFGYGNMCSWSKISDEKIQLPTILENGEPKIAFDFIEKFVATLHAERVATLHAYLKTAGLKDYTLTVEEQAALDDLNAVTWGTFKIEDVLVWQQNISELNPLHLDALTISAEKKYPFYGQATSNNGIIEYRHLKDEVLNNPSGKPTILIHSNNQNTVYLDTPFYLKDGHGATSVLQSKNLDKETAQFFMASIKKVILQKYTYNSKATKIELKKTVIDLPIKSDKTPNYDYMGLVISAMQKVVIKNVVDYLDERIMKTGELTS